jgi:benzoylformate decarboxylase
LRNSREAFSWGSIDGGRHHPWPWRRRWFSIQALWTAVEHKLPLVAVIIDNGGYLAVKRSIEGHNQVPHDKRVHPGTEIIGIDNVTIARGYGAEAKSVSDPEELGIAVAQALDSRKVTVISVAVAQNRP